MSPLANCCGVVLELVEQHRDEIDHRPHAGMALQVRRHVRVVLDRVQVDPGQTVLAGAAVAEIRLVHVPEQHQFERFGIGHGAMRDRTVPAQRWRKTSCPSISGVISVMPVLGDVEALAIFLRVEAGHKALGQHAALVDHARASASRAAGP